jgi:hypothetical protein
MYISRCKTLACTALSYDAANGRKTISLLHTHACLYTIFYIMYWFENAAEGQRETLS